MTWRMLSYESRLRILGEKEAIGIQGCALTKQWGSEPRSSKSRS